MTQDQLEQLLASHPTLHEHGMGLSACQRGTPAERAAYLNECRAALLWLLPIINRVESWLGEIARSTPRSRWTNSYHLKHEAERSIGEYVPNGVVIVAAMEVGIPWKLSDQGAPNVLLNMPTTGRAAQSLSARPL